MQFLEINGLGKVEVKKSARAKHIILSIKPDGQPKITLPQRVPLYFAKQHISKHKDWILKHSKPQEVRLISNNLQIGQNHSLKFQIGDKLASRVNQDSITVTYPFNLKIDDDAVQAEAKKAATRAIRRQAELYLPSKLYTMAQNYGYEFKEARVKALKTRWGSCSSEGIINLNIWLMQLPEELIEYVLAHELAHLRHHHHQTLFWQEVESLIPDYKQRRKALKQYRPALMI